MRIWSWEEEYNVIIMVKGNHYKWVQPIFRMGDPKSPMGGGSSIGLDWINGIGIINNLFQGASRY